MLITGFDISSIIMITGAIGAITAKDRFLAILWLGLAILGTFISWLCLQQEFLALSLMLIASGSLLVLFASMWMTHARPPRRIRITGIIATTFITVLLSVVLYHTRVIPIKQPIPTDVIAFGKTVFQQGLLVWILLAGLFITALIAVTMFRRSPH